MLYLSWWNGFKEPKSPNLTHLYYLLNLAFLFPLFLVSVGVCPHIDVHAHWIWTEAPNMIDKCWPGSCATSVLLLWFVTRWTPKPHEFTAKPFKRRHIVEYVTLRCIVWHCDDSWWDDRIKSTPSGVMWEVRLEHGARTDSTGQKQDWYCHWLLLLQCSAAFCPPWTVSPLWSPSAMTADFLLHPLKSVSQ